MRLLAAASLCIAVAIDRELGDAYNRLRRSIQRRCFDARAEFDREIPFRQMTLHDNMGRTD